MALEARGQIRTPSAPEEPWGPPARPIPEKSIYAHGTTPYETPNYELVEPDGKVSRLALERSGIDLERLPALQKIIDRFWRDETRSMEQRRRPDLYKGGNNYVIPSEPGRCAARIEALRRDVADLLGPEDAAKLLLALHPLTLFGCFGEFEVEYEVTKVDGRVEVRFENYNAWDGVLNFSGSGSPESRSIRRMFGPGFKFE